MVIGLIVLALLAYWGSRQRQLTGFVLNRVGASLGLEITAKGAAEYHLGGVPRVVLREVTARQPGARVPVLEASRVFLSLPWSTIRSGGEPLVLERLELDGARIDLPALQRWQATRPPTAPRLPTITRGIRIRDASVDGEGWRIADIQSEAPVFRADRPLRMRLQARYLAAPLDVPFELAVVLVHPEVLVGPGVSGFAAHGPVRVARSGEWRMLGYLQLSGPLHRFDGGMQLLPSRLGFAAMLESGDSVVPFALGGYGPLRVDANGVTLGPASVALRGRGEPERSLVPTLDAQGQVALGDTLRLHLDGRMADWPPSWPALPAPLSRSSAPLPFALDYDGAASLEDVAKLALARDATRFSARFRLPEVLAWIDRLGPGGVPGTGSPLPPLSGSLQTPRLELDGATLDGVRIEISDDASP